MIINGLQVLTAHLLCQVDQLHMHLQDYTGDQVTENFFAVLLGNKSAITGGSKKVIDSKPNDHIFIYYSDHGGPGVLGTHLDLIVS